MATRQRARSSKKAPAIPMQAAPTDDNESTAAADVPGIELSSSAPAQSGELSDELPQARFVGEQIIYKSREERIAESAYLAAEARGFAPGYELEDWLKAEKEVDTLLAGSDYPAN
jgi:hypothetical protein